MNLLQYIPQDLVEQIKQEVIAELGNYDYQYPYGGSMPADPNQALKQALKQELLAEMEINTNSAAYRDIATSLIDESTASTFSGPTNPSGQFRGLLYGLGAVALGALVLPSVGNKFRSVISRTVEDSSDLVDSAKSVLVRAKEGIEDIVAEASFKRLQSQFLNDDHDNPQV